MEVTGSVLVMTKCVGSQPRKPVWGGATATAIAIAAESDSRTVRQHTTTSSEWSSRPGVCVTTSHLPRFLACPRRPSVLFPGSVLRTHSLAAVLQMSWERGPSSDGVELASLVSRANLALGTLVPKT